MARLFQSLRVQLAVPGFAVLMATIVLVLTVAPFTQDLEVDIFVDNPDSTDETVADEKKTDELRKIIDEMNLDEKDLYEKDLADLALELDIDGMNITVDSVSRLSPNFFLLALLLTIPAALASWWWAGRVVKPIDKLIAIADSIESPSVNKRINLDGATIELQNLAGHLNRMLDRLATQSEIQQRLIEETSHELRTPMAVLTANSDVLLSDPHATDAEFRASASVTARTVARMRTVIDQLLMTARNQHYTNSQTENNLVAIAHEAVSSLEDFARPRKIELTFEAPEALYCALDQASVERALRNLIDNAIRYSEDNRSVSVLVGSDNYYGFVSVTDQGPGIPSDQQALIFDRYWSSRADTSKEHGIGLATVSQVAKAHAGVTIHSPVTSEGGACFTMRFHLST